ncbi:MAG: flagellar biosynthetic protein FliR [Ignavibacteriae bacterium HGW-Ignavibacteriae-2]|jgi:flagellar biosynthetic protein FliR|nr:flagellar biosynthetic protein FliR [Bacteroidota bacterium]PKL89267.1 MAG: flagellar biosynthetic protein FliR [Ignavibacteriae bacterium HGW-Ignavibacteriae-2]
MSNILTTDFLIVFLIFLRILFAFVAAPIYGHQAIPALTKVFLAFIIAYIIFSTLDTSSVTVEVSLLWIAINGIKEILTGLIIGFSLNIVFYGISFAGTLIGFEIGLSMATIFNPVDESSANVIGQLIYFLAMFVFFIINGHHYVIQALVSSFYVAPLGVTAITGPITELLIKYSASVFIIAVKISAPILVSFFMIQIAEGILARVIPQMQVFFVTYPIKLAVGFLIMGSLIPLYVTVIKSLLQDFESKLFTIVRVLGT